VLVEHDRRRHRDYEVEDERIKLFELGLHWRVHVVVYGGARHGVELGGLGLQIPDDSITPVGVCGGSREDELLDDALGRPVGDESLVLDIAASVAIGPPVVNLVVEAHIAVHLEGPESAVVVPRVADLPSWKGRTKPLDAAVVTGVGVGQTASKRLLTTLAGGFELERVGDEAFESGCSAVLLNSGQVCIEIVVLSLVVRA